MAKESGDLHTRKDSHVSLPVNGAEWHLHGADMTRKVQVDKTYKMVIPVICTSADDVAQRYRQVAKPYVSGSGRVFSEKTDVKKPYEPGPQMEKAVSKLRKS